MLQDKKYNRSKTYATLKVGYRNVQDCSRHDSSLYGREKTVEPVDK